MQTGAYDDQMVPWLAQANSQIALPLTPFRFLNEYLYSGSFSNLTVNGTTQASACSGMSVGTGASLNGFLPFLVVGTGGTTAASRPSKRV